MTLTLLGAGIARGETKQNLTLGLDAGAGIITDSYLAGISNTVGNEYRGHVGYEHWTGFQAEMIFSYANWSRGTTYCYVQRVCGETSAYAVLGGLRYTLPFWIIRSWVEAAIGVGHTEGMNGPRSSIGGGIDFLVYEQSIAIGVRADMNYLPYTHDRDGGPTDDDWVFIGAGVLFHVY